MKRVYLILFLSICAISLAIKNYAADEAFSESEEIKLYLGQTKIISVSSPTRIVIGNPSIVDVDNSNLSKKELPLIPKSAGSTTLVVWDNFGEHPYRLKVVSEDLSEAKSRIDSLLATLKYPEVYTQLQEEEGKILLLGRVKEPQDREKIDTALAGALGSLKNRIVDLVDVKEEETVIDIDVQVLEVNRGAGKTLGIEWPQSATFTEPSTRTAWRKLAGTLDAFFRVTEWSRSTAFSAAINFLEEHGQARTLSRPRIVCQSGKEARLLVGGEKPIFSQTLISSGGGLTSTSSVEYKEFGIILTMKPVLVAPNRIKIGLDMQVSEVGAYTTVSSSSAFPLTKRSVTTEVLLNNNDILIIGGLVKQKNEETVKKFPFLSNIPILGIIFRNKANTTGGGSSEKSDTELLITLTPKIVDTKEQAENKLAAPEPQAENADSPTQSTGLPKPLAEYTQIVKNRILESLTYPASAKEAGFQGTVKLKLQLSYSGELLDIAVKESSGYEILDDNALSVAKQIASYPPFPPSIEQRELWIEIPVIYRLN